MAGPMVVWNATRRHCCGGVWAVPAMAPAMEQAMAAAAAVARARPALKAVGGRRSGVVPCGGMTLLRVAGSELVFPSAHPVTSLGGKAVPTMTSRLIVLVHHGSGSRGRTAMHGTCATGWVPLLKNGTLWPQKL